MRLLLILANGLLLFCSSVVAEQKRIDPAMFEWMSKTGVDILRSYRHYASMIDENAATFLFDVDAVFVQEPQHVVPSSVGEVKVTPGHVKFAIYYDWRSERKSKDTRGLMLLSDSLDLQLDPASNSALGNGVYSDVYGWTVGNIVLGYRASEPGGNQTAIGFVLNSHPYITVDTSGNPQFDFYFDEELGEYTGDIAKEGIFIHLVRSDHDFAVVIVDKIKAFEYRSRALQTVEGLTIGSNYYHEKETWQLGLELNKRKLNKLASVNAEVFFNVHSEDDAATFAYAVTEVVVMPIHNLSNDNIKTMFPVRIGVSYVNDFFQKELFGMGVSAGINDFSAWNSHFSFTFGISRNYQKTLYRVPLKDENFTYGKITMWF